MSVLLPTYERLAEALDGLDIAVCVFDEEDRSQVWNRAFLAFFPEHDGQVFRGESYRENLHRFYRRRLTAEELPEIERYVADGIARHRAQSRPFVFLYGGQWVKVSSLPLPAGGRIRLWTRIAGPTAAMTHPSAAASGEGQEVVRADLESLSEGIMLLNPDGRILTANRAFLDIYGLPSRAALTGNTYEGLLRSLWADKPCAPSERQAIDRYLTRIAEDQRFQGAPFEIPLFGGRWVRVTEQHGEAGVIYSTHVDISALKRQQIAMDEARLAADRANQAKSTFLAMMSHEIRTPMHGIIGMAENLLESGLDEAQAGYAETIRKSSLALLAILNDILDLSKLEIGRIELERAAFRPDELVADAVRLVAAQAQEKGLTLEVETDPALARHVQGDPSRVRQVLLNLLANAVKFTPAGSVSVAARAMEAPGGRRLRVEVRDTGIGFDEAKLDRLFQTFQQGDADISRRFGGTGLGLSISRQLVELMGGAIGAQARPSGGSLFWFEIPAPPAEPKKPAAPEPPRLPPGLRILVVEDNATNQAVVRAILQRAGCEVAIAGDGATALALAPEIAPDLVLMDIQLPDTDGFALTAELRRLLPLGRDIPFLALTANAMEGYRELCLRHSLNDYLSKPFTRDALLAKIARWVHGRPAGTPDAVDPTG